MKNLYERAKFVQKDIFEIVKSLRFIKMAMENDGSKGAESAYNMNLIKAMVVVLLDFADDSASELLKNLEIEEPEATGGEV